jgi:hypothetical protein
MRDKFHWSFSGGSIFKKIFREGFSADESSLPQGDFDPGADWENSYDVVYVGPQSFTKDAHVYFGSLRVGAEFKIDRVNHNVSGIRQLNQDFNCERQHLQAECVCKRDELFSLKEGSVWRVENHLKNQRDPATLPYGRIDETGRLKPGRIEKTNAAGKWYNYRTIDAKVPVVSDWAMMAAVGSLRRNREYKFGYFPQLERFNAGHKICFVETFQARFGDRDIRLHGYAQTGPGITPSFYWVDDHGRLLIARFAVSAIVYNPKPLVERQSQHDK